MSNSEQDIPISTKITILDNLIELEEELLDTIQDHITKLKEERKELLYGFKRT